jgi:hypothetical protein
VRVLNRQRLPERKIHPDTFKLSTLRRPLTVILPVPFPRVTRRLELLPEILVPLQPDVINLLESLELSGKVADFLPDLNRNLLFTAKKSH